MTDAIRKRRKLRASYDAALASWRASHSGVCPACHDTLAINHEDAAVPCPMCRPDEAREAARGTTP